MTRLLGRIEREVQQILGKKGNELPRQFSKPFGQYTDMADCIASISDDVADKPAYCATVMRALEGKETPWMDEKKWGSERTFVTYLGDTDEVDKQEEQTTLKDYVLTAPFLVKYGVVNWFHDGQVLGQPLAWRVMKHPTSGQPTVAIKAGLIDPDEHIVPESFKGELEGAWKSIVALGKDGKTSIEGIWARKTHCENGICWKITDKMALWAVAFVSTAAANRGANIIEVNSGAKEAPSLNDCVKAAPPNTISLKASWMKEHCPGSKAFYEELLADGVNPETAEKALQQALDAKLNSIKSQAHPQPIAGSVKMASPPGQEPTQNDQMMAMLQELAKRLKTLEEAYGSQQKPPEAPPAEKTAPPAPLTPPDPLAGVKSLFQESFGPLQKSVSDIDTRLKTIEGMAIGPGQKGSSLPPPPKDVSPDQKKTDVEKGRQILNNISQTGGDFSKLVALGQGGAP
jgi:hypothetical protein